MNIQAIWKKADSLRGCLLHLKTTVSRRRFAEDEDRLSIGNDFVSDEARLLSSKRVRVLSKMTQVFTFPQTPLIRSRLSHIMEVVAVSVVTSDMLGLNTDLVRAAAVGHDMGHVPFGHQGETWLAREIQKPFCHEVMGAIIAQKVERKGKGLNLCWHTLDAMMRHSGATAQEGMSQEAWILRNTDKFAYIFHDVNDVVMRMQYPIGKELTELVNLFGSNQRERTTTAIAGLVIESAELGKVSFEYSELGQKFQELRGLMYGVYVHVTKQNVENNMRPALDFLSMLGLGDPFLLLALMTDEDVSRIVATPMHDMQLFNRLSVSEIAPYLGDIGKIDLCDPDLNW